MKKILIAEDDKFLANAYRAKMVKAGFDVLIVKDGDEILKSVETYSPDLVLLDLVMPKRDGFSVLEELKKDPKYNTLPVIIASNLGQREDMQKALALGAKDFIIKSDFSLDQIVEKINLHIGK
ncbi:MAG: response regulator [Candidatus Roizmanbacteria bacterium]